MWKGFGAGTPDEPNLAADRIPRRALLLREGSQSRLPEHIPDCVVGVPYGHLHRLPQRTREAVDRPIPELTVHCLDDLQEDSSS